MATIKTYNKCKFSLFGEQPLDFNSIRIISDENQEEI